MLMTGSDILEGARPAQLSFSELQNLKSILNAAHACLGRPGCYGCAYSRCRKDCRNRLLDDIYNFELRLGMIIESRNSHGI